jgi:phosphatidylserine decarboxylase
VKVLFVLIQYLAPQHLLSRLTGWLAECRVRWLKDLLIRAFAWRYQVDMSEAREAELSAYPTFNDFFTRALKDGARPIEGDEGDIVCPADGVISQLGEIREGRLFQAKGHDYGLTELLGGDEERAARFANGHFATIYLAPRDYHRVHMPLAGELRAMRYVPGRLFSVNEVTADHVPGLFARNERAVCHFDTAAGPMTVVLVGAMIVAGIETVWAGQVAPASGGLRHTDYAERQRLERGEEMGRFKLGSTVILLFGDQAVSWLEDYRAGSRTRLGQRLGRVL